MTWLEPTIAVDVSYGRLMQGWLREPVCRGLAEDVRTERPAPRRNKKLAGHR